MKKILLALIYVMIFTITAFAGEVLAVFRAVEGVEVSSSNLSSDGELMASVKKTAEEVGAEVVKVYDSLSESDGNIFVLLRSKNKTTEELITALKNRPEILTVSPNKRSKLKWKSDAGKRPNDPDFTKLWGLETIRAPEAWELTTGGKDKRRRRYIKLIKQRL